MAHQFNCQQFNSREEQSLLPEVLTRVYKRESLLTYSANYLGNGRATVNFLFPSYSRTVNEIDHVSAMQITGCIIEGWYCAVEDGLYSGRLPSACTQDWFYSACSMNQWLMTRMDVVFRKTLVYGTITPLDFSIVDVSLQRFRKTLLSVTVSYDGFVSGEMTSVIKPPSNFS